MNYAMILTDYISPNAYLALPKLVKAVAKKWVRPLNNFTVKVICIKNGKYHCTAKSISQVGPVIHSTRVTARKYVMNKMTFTDIFGNKWTFKKLGNDV